MDNPNQETTVSPEEANAFVVKLNAQGEVTPEKRHRFKLEGAYTLLRQDLADGHSLGSENIKRYHEILAANIPQIRKGDYSLGIRSIPNMPWEVKAFTPPEQIPKEMSEYGSFLSEAFKFHPETPSDYIKLVDKAVQVMIKFVDIHPFGDGNGRTSRLLTDGILMSGGLYQMPHCLEPEVEDIGKARNRFFLMIETARQYGDYRLLLRFMTRQQLLALNMELEAIEENTQALIEANSSGYVEERIDVRNSLEDIEEELSSSIIENPPKPLPSKKQ